MDEQKLKMARLFGEAVRLRTRSQHFLPVTGKGGQVVIPGIGSLGARHEMTYGVRPEQYAHMRDAVLYAIWRLLGDDYNDEIGRAWSEIFDMLARAMQEHVGENPAASAFAKLSMKGGPKAAPLIEWSDRLSVGIVQIDNEHKRLLVLLNELNSAVEGGVGQGVLGGVLEGLIHYASYHFSHEEELFQRSNYPGYERHRQQHVALGAKVTEIYAAFHTGEAVPPGAGAGFPEELALPPHHGVGPGLWRVSQGEPVRALARNASPLKKTGTPRGACPICCIRNRGALASIHKHSAAPFTRPFPPRRRFGVRLQRRKISEAGSARFSQCICSSSGVSRICAG